MAEVRIKTSFGYFVIPYSNKDDLEKQLDSLPELVSLVQSKTTSVVPTESRIPKPGWEQVYAFDSNGRLSLLKKPSVKVSLTTLALFASDPDPMNVDDLERVTGIADIVKSVLGQTKNKKYFVQRTDGTYGLSPLGFDWVTKKVMPSLR
jgi:hypothetical protein